MTNPDRYSRTPELLRRRELDLLRPFRRRPELDPEAGPANAVSRENRHASKRPKADALGLLLSARATQNRLADIVSRDRWRDKLAPGFEPKKHACGDRFLEDQASVKVSLSPAKN